MYSLSFNKDICLACETLDCLLRCQYIDIEIEAAKAEKKKIVNGQYSDILKQCATCYACEEYCPNSNHPFFQIVELQEEIGYCPAPRPITNQQIKMYAPKGDNDLGYGLRNPSISLCLFPDMKERLSGEIFEETSSFLGRDFFCNLVYLHFAKMSLIKERLPQVVDNINKNLAKSGLKELVCFHDECFAGFTYWAEAYGLEVPFTPIHLYEFLLKRLKALKERIKPLGSIVAYQRPCSNRLIPKTQGLVDEVFRLIGARRADRKYDRENALCCGSIIIMQGRDELAEEVQEKNIQDMVDSGARYCLFNCPMCYYTLGEKVEKRGITPVTMPDLCRFALEEVQEEYGEIYE